MISRNSGASVPPGLSCALPVCLGLLAIAIMPAAAQGPPTLVLARPEDQERFQVTTFATGLAFPTSLAELADGSLLVAESSGTSLWSSTEGRLVRLVDADADGVADGPGTVVASGPSLPGLVTSIHRVDDMVFALSSQAGNQAITLWRTGATAAAPLEYSGRFSFSFPAGFEHTTFALTARETPGNLGDLEVYFNIGAAANSVATPSTSTVGLSSADIAFPPASLVADSIYRVRINDSVTSLTATAPELIATGLRNAAGLVFDRQGNLVLQDNGIDTEGNRDVSFSADEINRINAADLGHSVPNFGFPETYIRYSDGASINPSPSVTDPLVAFLPIDGRRSEGAVEISLAPPSFPADFSSGVFTAFYGQSGGGSANFENPVVFANPDTGEYFHFVENQLLGHPNGLLATSDSLFLTDLSWIGSLSGSVNGVNAKDAGVIYRVTPVPEPAACSTYLVACAAIAGWHRRRRNWKRQESVLPVQERLAAPVGCLANSSTIWARISARSSPARPSASWATSRP